MLFSTSYSQIRNLTSDKYTHTQIHQYISYRYKYRSQLDGKRKLCYCQPVVHKYRLTTKYEKYLRNMQLIAVNIQSGQNPQEPPPPKKKKKKK